jgi:hypothetical protein
LRLSSGDRNQKPKKGMIMKQSSSRCALMGAVLWGVVNVWGAPAQASYLNGRWVWVGEEAICDNDPGSGDAYPMEIAPDGYLYGDTSCTFTKADADTFSQVIRLEMTCQIMDWAQTKDVWHIMIENEQSFWLWQANESEQWGHSVSEEPQQWKKCPD